MKRFFFISIFFFGLFALANAQEVSHYRIEAAFDPDTHSISGTLILDYYNAQKESISIISLMLLANLEKEANESVAKIVQDVSYRYGFESTFTEISRVSTSNNEKLPFKIHKGFEFLQKYSTKEAVLDVMLKEPLEPHERYTIRIEFKTKLAEKKSDLGYYQDVYTARFGWFPQELPIVDGKATEGFLFNAFTYQLKITFPESYILAQIGDQFYEEIVDGKHLYASESKIPVRTIPLSFSNKFKRYTKKIGDLIVNVYGPQKSPWILHGNHDDDAEFLFKKVGKIISHYAETFGPLPHGFITFTIHYGEEVFFAADGLIYIAETFFFKDMMSPGLKDRVFEYIVAHEVAHLYWGIAVSNDFYSDDWIAEGLAEYSSISYLEKTYGKADNFFETHSIFFIFMYLVQAFDPLSYYFPKTIEESYFLNYRRFVLDGIDQPIHKETHFPYDRTNFDYVRTYIKSYLILKSLAAYVGKEEFNELLRKLYHDKNTDFITTHEFEKIVQESTYKDVSQFFSDWFYHNHHLDYEVVSLQSSPIKKTFFGPIIRNEIMINRYGKAYLPFTLKIEYEDKTTKLLFIDNEKESFSIVIESDKKIVSVELDPNQDLPDFSRENNYYPRKPIKYSLLFEYPLDGYNINFSPYIFGGYGIRINGHFLDDHYWTFLANYTGDFVYFIERFAYHLGRGQFCDITLNQVLSTDSVQEFFLINELGYSFTLFEKNKLGLTRFTDIDANHFRLALGFNHFKELSVDTVIGDNTKDELPDVIEYVRFNYTRNDIVSLGLINEFEALYSPELISPINNQLARFTLRTSKLAKLTSYINSYGFLEAGYNTEHNIQFYKFDLDELYLFDDVTPSLRRFLGSVEFSHPLLRTRRTRYFGIFEDSLSFLNSVAFEGLSIGVLARAGYLWDNDFGSSEIHGAYGPFIEILNRTFFDVEFNVRVGSVFPINQFAATDDYKIFVEAFAAF